MKIELRKLRVDKRLSEETMCYSAEIWIDDARAFVAGNRGHGGPDDFHQVGTTSLADVEAWLATTRPPRVAYGLTMKHDLEMEVSDLMIEAEQIATLRRRMKTNVVTIEGEQVYTYSLKGRAVSNVVASIRRSKPDVVVVNEGGDVALSTAVKLLLDAARKAEESAAL